MIMNIWKGLAKGCMVGLIFLCLGVIATGAWAAHEVSQSDIKANVLLNTATKWTEDLTVEWTAPSMGSNVLNGYIYKWNSSSSLLDDTVFNAATGRDGTVEPDVNPPNVVKSKTDLANLDSGDLLYLHLKTWYLDIATQTPKYSSDVYYGPFLIDNKAPEGTIRIVDVNGNDISSSTDTLIYLKLAAAKDPAKMYLSETSTRPSTGQTYSADAAYGLGDTTAGAKTIYAWFEDGVGNISATPATDSYTLLSSISINPNTATIDLASVGTQVFRVEGTSATYNWAIIEQVPETTGTVAEISIGGTGTNEVTVKGLAKGTFKLQAVPTAGGDTLTSGTITVVQGYTKGDVNNDGTIDSGDAILVLRYSVGLITLTETQKAAGNVTSKVSNNDIDSGDAIKILRYSVGLITSL